jgi:Zn-dependent M28 family amino/carboxypeptidase
MKLVKAKPDPKPMPDAIRHELDSVSQVSLRAVVEQIAVPRVYRSAENATVRGMVIDLLSVSLGCDRRTLRVDDAGNVVGGDPIKARVLIGAHYDAVPGTPGADDNASAVAVLLAVAGTIGPREDVCYVAFDGEECNLAGSRSFVERLGPNRLESVHVLEMVGFTDRRPGSQRNPVPVVQAPTVGDFLGLVGTHGSSHLLDHILGTAGHSAIPVYGLYLPDVPAEMIRQVAPHVLRSDHAPFWAAGIPALMWTDTAEFRNPNYHRPTDTPDTLDYAFMAEVARLLTHTVLTSFG